MTETATNNVDVDASWSLFATAPATYASPMRLAACFAGRITENRCRELLASQRLQQRLSALLFAFYKIDPTLGDIACADIDRRIALASANEFAGIARRSGAIFWGNALANIVLAQAVSAFHNALGEDLCTFAIANRILASDEQALPNIEVILTDGWQCVNAWSSTLPSGVAERVRLKFSGIEARTSSDQFRFVGCGPAIVRRAGDF
jgi:hypothetical protein